jgi:hypothetical protein
MEECHWKAKEYQRKASRFNEKTGYEVVSVIIDKMIKHNSIFTLSNPTPSEVDVMIKIWACGICTYFLLVIRIRSHLKYNTYKYHIS